MQGERRYELIKQKVHSEKEQEAESPAKGAGVRKGFRSNTKYQTSEKTNPHLTIGLMDFKNQIWGPAYKIKPTSDFKV